MSGNFAFLPAQCPDSSLRLPETAAPKEDVDRNTYQLFNLESRVPLTMTASKDRYRQPDSVHLTRDGSITPELLLASVFDDDAS